MNEPLNTTPQRPNGIFDWNDFAPVESVESGAKPLADEFQVELSAYLSGSLASRAPTLLPATPE